MEYGAGKKLLALILIQIAVAVVCLHPYVVGTHDVALLARE